MTAAPASLPWERLGFPPEELRRFQAALRSQHSDPRVRPTGEWDLYDEEVYRDLGAPTVPAGFVHITEPFWSTVMVDPHRIAEPWGAGPPTESDLLEFVPDLPEGDAGEVSCTMPAVPCKVDVVVHHRGLAEREGADVRVTLLRWTRTPADTIPRANDPSTWVPGDISWHLGAAEVLNSTDASVSNPFEGPEGGWRFVGRTQAVRRTDLTGRTLDNLTSGVVTFDLDLTPFRNNTVMVLVAVIRAGADIVIPETPLRDLVLGHPGIAARSIRIER